MSEPLRFTFLGLSITSSWGNGHATTYRSLLRELDRLGHDVTFLERNVPWYQGNRDLPDPPFAKTLLYDSLQQLKDRFERPVREADLVVVGSYVPDGVDVGRWAIETARGPVAFYDIDTPVTMAKLERGDHEYLSPELIPRYDGYLSFTGGPVLDVLERRYGSPYARPLHCSVDPEHYRPQDRPERYLMGYLGTYSRDRQPKVERLLLDAARQRPDEPFIVAGPQYPEEVDWGPNVEHVDHLPPSEHPAFYNAQRVTLNITREDMVAWGHSPSVRIFEASACGVPIISDPWEGFESFLKPGREVLLAETTDEVLAHLARDPAELARIGQAARERVLAEHTAPVRAQQLTRYARTMAERTQGVAVR